MEHGYLYRIVENMKKKFCVPDCDDLSAFIQQTNMDVVSPSERLSNQVYMYDRKENSIEMVTRNKLDIIPQESRNISYEKNIKPEI